MSIFRRHEIRGRLQEKIAAGRPIVAAGAGAGIVAKFAAKAGVDLIMAYCTGPYRQNGNATPLGYMGYGDCNQISLELGRQMCQVAGDTPLIAGIGVADPYRRLDVLLEELSEAGFCGVTNVPTVGGHEGAMRTYLEQNGLGFDAEVRLIADCADRGIFTAAYAFDDEQVRKMCGAGADVVGAHVGGTTGGATGFPQGLTLEQAIEKVDRLCRIAREENPQTWVLCHGGPFATPETVQQCLCRTPTVGYIGASSIERIPLEKAVYEVCSSYVQLSLGNRGTR